MIKIDLSKIKIKIEKKNIFKFSLSGRYIHNLWHEKGSLTFLIRKEILCQLDIRP